MNKEKVLELMASNSNFFEIMIQFLPKYQQNQLKVVQWLLKHADENKRIFASVKIIAQESNVSYHTALKAINFLKENRMLESPTKCVFQLKLKNNRIRQREQSPRKS